MLVDGEKALKKLCGCKGKDKNCPLCAGYRTILESCKLDIQPPTRTERSEREDHLVRKGAVNEVIENLITVEVGEIQNPLLPKDTLLHKIDALEPVKGQDAVGRKIAIHELETIPIGTEERPELIARRAVTIIKKLPSVVPAESRRSEEEIEKIRTSIVKKIEDYCLHAEEIQATSQPDAHGQAERWYERARDLEEIEESLAKLSAPDPADKEGGTGEKG